MNNIRLLTAIVVITVSVSVIATVIHVPGDYQTIQQAINAGNPFDTVMVGNGTYQEHLNIRVSLSLVGDGVYSTIIEGGNTGTVINITANFVTIKDTQVRGSGTASDNAGILLQGADSCVIDANIVWYNNTGILVKGGKGNIVSRNMFREDPSGCIRLSENPNDFHGTEGDIIENNYFESDNGVGIDFAHILYHHYHNIVRGNYLAGNSVGILMITSQENSIYGNDIRGNSNYGISISMCDGGGQNNQFYHNNFCYNGETGQAYDMFGNNFWYGQQNSQGNYWSDYFGSDENHDGIGDQPMSISGNGGVDSFPLMTQLYASVSGMVTNQLSEPLDSVHVIYSDEIDTYSSNDGHYTLQGLPAGVGHITCFLGGYQQLTVPLVPLTLAQTTTLDVRIQPQVGINEDQAGAIPKVFGLCQNYPNPFNSQTVISFELKNATAVKLEVFDITGALVTSQSYQSLSAGHHEIVWDASMYSSGIYYSRLTAGTKSLTGRMVLLK